MSVETERLPHLDEHSLVVEAGCEDTWTRAEFPGLKGGVYRALVIGTRMHVLATRRMLAGVKRNAERS